MAWVACVVGFLLLRESEHIKSQRTAAILLARFAFASAVGLSVLVTFTFVVFVVLLIPTAVLRRWYDDIVGFGGAGAIAFVLAVPFLRILTGAGAVAAHASAGGAPFAVFSVRGF